MPRGIELFDHHPFASHWQDESLEDPVRVFTNFLRKDTVVNEVGEKGEKEDITENDLPLKG